ncbi:MAG: hypothetical protein OEW35_18880 [Gammaproteobacteria bacterium]|nr:hypothetical protein [Gammaproteobacteria bacterium]
MNKTNSIVFRMSAPVRIDGAPGFVNYSVHAGSGSANGFQSLSHRSD